MGHRIDHFKRAQEYTIEQAIKEIRSGKKTGHWIWYIFPQMKGLGKSGMSETYAIEDREHAYIYMNSPILCNNYICCCQAILDSGKSAYEIFGDDVVKVRSSLLLMNSVWNDPIIKKVLIEHHWL
jgi:uncharacterized protein (DUF1810 family)